MEPTAGKALNAGLGLAAFGIAFATLGFVGVSLLAIALLLRRHPTYQPIPAPPGDNAAYSDWQNAYKAAQPAREVAKLSLAASSYDPQESDDEPPLVVPI